jgi:L-threonylcarbamoyladenylate synthase
MENSLFDNEVGLSLDILKRGGVILYPTDTIWGIGCDATSEPAIRRIYEIKKRPDHKSLIILVAEDTDILQYVADPDPQVFDFMEEQTKPTTIIFNNAIGLPENLVAEDGSIAIRVVKDPFCRHLIKRLRKPIISTSANISGHPSPLSFIDISEEIKAGVDHIVAWRQNDNKASMPSQIIKWQQNGAYIVIRS